MGVDLLRNDVSKISKRLKKSGLGGGWVIEWFKVPVLKTGVLLCTVGSNPTPSENLKEKPGKVAEWLKALVC
jgi:hypothetical protein